jgi:hypothetical protein
MQNRMACVARRTKVCNNTQYQRLSSANTLPICPSPWNPIHRGLSSVDESLVLLLPVQPLFDITCPTVTSISHHHQYVVETVHFFDAAVIVRLVTPGDAGFLDNALQPHVARLQHLYTPAQLSDTVFASALLCFLHTEWTSQARCSTEHGGMAFNYEL